MSAKYNLNFFIVSLILQEFVVSVLEQLVDSHLCSQYKFKYINPRPLQAFLPIDTEVSESPHGAVRAEVYERSCNALVFHLPVYLFVCLFVCLLAVHFVCFYVYGFLLNCSFSSAY